MAAKQKKLVIVESPAKAGTIGKFLGRGYKVMASQGHVRDLPRSQLGVDVEDDFAMRYITIRGKGEILAMLRKEAKSASDILLATDPDREGEAISWHLAEVLKIDDDALCRVEFNEITKKSVAAAIKKPRAINMDLVDAQQARRALDRLVGYKISPLLWAKVKKGLSAGRVQSVAVRLIVDREEEIEGFVPEEYWDAFAQVPLHRENGQEADFQVRLAALDGKKAELTNQAQAEDAKKRMESAKLSVKEVRNREKRKSPAPPFTTSTLQQEASRKLNFTIAKCMQVVQGLYEGVELTKGNTQGLVTYIRTDSVRVSEDALSAVRGYIGDSFGADYLPESANQYKGRTNAQDAHEAIRPVDVSLTPEAVKSALTRDQFQLYRLIHARFVASQMTDARFETRTIDMEGDGVLLRYYGEVKRFAGFTAVYEEGSDEAQDSAASYLPQATQGDAVTINEVTIDQHFTQPPGRYTEASLVRTLEEKGIGRPSTYAPTVTTVITRGYVSREKKRLYPTELGRMVNDLMKEYFATIVDPDFTARMEAELDAVEAGETPWKKVLRDFYPPFEEQLKRADEAIEKVEIADEVSDTVCDQCGAMMVYKMGRYGRFLACPNFPECRNTLPILVYIDAPCPACGARLLEKTSRKNRKFYGCERYPECDFVSWDQPVSKPCPKCGSYMTLKRRRDQDLLLCSNESCRHREEVERADEEA
ncbi:MAG: type I DNA topoisomerase [Christensenellales bacterium]